MRTFAGGRSTLDDDAYVLTMQQACYDQGSDPDTLMVTPTNSLEIADFAAVADTRIRDFGSASKVVNVVDVYVSPFGKVNVVLNRFIKDKHTLLFDAEMWAKCYLRNWTRETLAKTGDNVQM